MKKLLCVIFTCVVLLSFSSCSLVERFAGDMSQLDYKEDKPMKNRPYVYRLKLTDFELRVMVNILNDRRMRMKANGEDPAYVSDIILKCLDALEA